MSAIAGFSAQNSSAIQSMLNHLKHWAPHRSDIYQSQYITLGSLELFNTPEAHLQPQPFVYKDFVLVANCRIDNRDELALEFNLPNKNAIADIKYIALAYEKWGNECVDHLYGDFAFVIYDHKKDKIFGARDHIGIKTLYYSINATVLIFASEIKGILGYKDLKPAYNEAYYVHALSAVSLPATETPFANIHQFPAGSYFEWQNKDLKITKYWELGSRFAKIPETRAAQENEFRTRLFESVNCRLRTANKIGAELSGGLDSTGIVAIAMEILGKGSEFYSYFYGKALNPLAEDKQNIDDRHFVEEFCNRYEITDYLTVVNEDHYNFDLVLELFKDVYDDCEANGVPLAAGSFLPDAKSKNVSVILSGHGGDHLVTSISTAYYNPKACKKMYKGLWKELRQEYSFGPAFLRFIYYSIKGLNPNHFKRQNIIFNREIMAKSSLNPKLIEKYKLKNIPSDRYFLHHQTNRLDRFKQTIGYPPTQTRAYHHDLTGKHFNAEYRFPLLDVRLLEYMISLPADTIAPKAKPRYLFYKVVRNYIPEGIPILKSKIGSVPFFGSFMKMNLNNVKTEVDKTLDNKEFSSLIDPEKINNIPDQSYFKLLKLSLLLQK
ncbi:asparagine synthetase B [Pedobacter changchengzhani]|uniref:asparagine synthase (glutamine-hydrolyzing) n=1 Tax=Pedobacter changchengzhani TaxID=2529274 RepID=A0A4R5MPG9_9SPHI|nr:asparagine synthase-related protein [Pedobacter changchengzhani]TDG37684.1 asparagine synthetase B [Pedobacter changchengzhani]